MNIRKEPLVSGNYYHIYTRSIAKFVIFNNENEYLRMMEILDLYRYTNFQLRYAQFSRFKNQTQINIINDLRIDNQLLVEIVTFCLMPTHIHLILKQVSKDGISKFMSRILNSYSKYFNTKHHRSGPLWESTFKNVLVTTDMQLLHLTRYLHLNPVSADIVKLPEDWLYSSYDEYTDKNIKDKDRLCNFKGLIEMSPIEYRDFVNDRISYQKELSLIKNILIEDYSG